MRGRSWPVALLTLWGTAARGEIVLHEYVPPVGQPSTSTAMPSEIRVDDRTLPRPSGQPGPGASERVVEPDRTTRIDPDRTTTHDGTLRYRAQFNPSVVPFKRMTAMDAVGPQYSLHVRDRSLQPVRVLKVPPSPDRDLFWGSLALSGRGRPLPIPSVAPEARILSYTTTPPSVEVGFFRDSADNFWVKTGHRGPLRLVFLTDAPRRYFSPRVPPMVTVGEVPRAMRPRLPAAVQSAAQRVIQQVGVDRRASLMRQLDRLVAYFRNFRAGALPRITGDTYLDIALSQRGVCRHRSFAFVITAHALGIPARYVQNEAHAFTEVFVPRMGWARVDLGGASNELQVLDASEKAVHAPGPDPFPSPSSFATNYSRLNRNVTGVRPAQRLRRSTYRVALDSYDRSGATSGGATSGGAAAGTPSGPTTGDVADSPTTATPGEEAGDEVGDDAPEPAPPRRQPTQISVFTSARSVFRGEQVAVWGRVTTAQGQGASGLRVELFLSQDGRVSDALLGATVTGEDGRFTTTLAVPVVKVGQYRVFAATAGDGAHEASISR